MNKKIYNVIFKKIKCKIRYNITLRIKTINKIYNNLTILMNKALLVLLFISSLVGILGSWVYYSPFWKSHPLPLPSKKSLSINDWTCLVLAFVSSLVSLEESASMLSTVLLWLGIGCRPKYSLNTKHQLYFLCHLVTRPSHVSTYEVTLV